MKRQKKEREHSPLASGRGENNIEGKIVKIRKRGDVLIFGGARERKERE